MVKIGNIELFNETESYNNGVNITEYEVEKGSPFSDHVRQSNPNFSVSGFIFNDDWELTISELEQHMNNGDLLKYIGKYNLSDVLIRNIRTSGDKSISNGVSLTLDLVKVRITKTSYQKAPKLQVAQRKPITNSGEKKQVGERDTKPGSNTPVTAKFHTVVKGDTYWGLSQKYGVSVSSVMALNTYPATKIPIGVKLRIS